MYCEILLTKLIFNRSRECVFALTVSLVFVCEVAERRLSLGGRFRFISNCQCFPWLLQRQVLAP